MKILTLHCDFIRFKPVRKAIKEAEAVGKKEVEVKNALVVLTAVEKSDEDKPAAIADSLAANVEDIAKKVKAKKVVLYPYAHLSANLASPKAAVSIMKDAEKQLKKAKLSVTRAPFGWYKQFSLQCKGHPLSELSRSIEAGGKAKEEKEGKPKKFISKTVLEKEKLSKNDHRIIGKQLDLFSFHSIAPGMVSFHPKGTIIRNELIKFWREEYKKAGYKEIVTPLIMNKRLWEISGHYEHYKENMFFTKIDNVDYAVKPMNCPGALLVYVNSQRSYKDLPLRLSELGLVHRGELTGVLSGLFRLRALTQDDSHIFITERQLEDEIIKVINLTASFYKIFGFEYHIELSTKPKKAMGSAEMWKKAEAALKNALKKKKLKFKIKLGEGAFYGPKIDFHIKDSLGRTWQCATIQVDFSMPERFDINYIGEDSKKHRPVMIHHVIYGSIERFIGILVEHYKGNFPLWLAPIQCRIASFTDRNKKFAEKIAKEISETGIRVDTDFYSRRVEYKVREAELQKIPYIIVIGDKEEKAKTLAVRKHLKKEIKFGVKLQKFISDLRKEIDEKK